MLDLRNRKTERRNFNETVANASEVELSEETVVVHDHGIPISVIRLQWPNAHAFRIGSTLALAAPLT